MLIWPDLFFQGLKLCSIASSLPISHTFCNQEMVQLFNIKLKANNFYSSLRGEGRISKWSITIVCVYI